MHWFSRLHRLLTLPSVPLGVLNYARVARNYPASGGIAKAVGPVLAAL